MAGVHSRRGRLKVGGFMIGALDSVGFIELARNEAEADLRNRQLVSTQLVRLSPKPHGDNGNGG